MSEQIALSSNRAEEFGEDAWKHFVIPPNFERLGLKGAKKTRVIYGGRGSGKTMLLQFLSHTSEFSQEHSQIPTKSIEHIGLYWRADTHFCSSFKALGKEEVFWINAFDHFLALTVSFELLKSIKSIALSNCDALTINELNSINFDILKGYDETIPNTYEDIYDYIDNKQIELQSWVSNMLEGKRPTFLPGFLFVIKIIELIKRQLPKISAAEFYIYVDEYENLIPYQQRVLKDYIKHGKSPLILHFAMKRFALLDRSTSGNEDIQEIHDFRYVDIEEGIDEKVFKVFSAEILLSELTDAKIYSGIIDKNLITDVKRINERKDQDYQYNIVADAKNIFPEMTLKELSKLVLEDKTTRDKLKDRLQKVLKIIGSEEMFDKYFDLNYPEAVIIIPSILNRNKINVTEIYSEFSAYKNGNSKKFRELINNNLVGSLLLLYQTHNKICPLYSGFSTLCIISQMNLRFFLEICFKSIEFQRFENNSDITNLSPFIQSKAAVKASGRFLEEIKGSGSMGIKLHSFVQRLGGLFKLAHKRPSQSENEQNHFSISKGNYELCDEDRAFIIEALKYNILIDYPGNKIKSDTLYQDEDLRLNPIYTPFFNISYRKKRKLEIQSDEFNILLRGNSDEYNNLLKEYSKKWDITTNDKENLRLF